MPVQIIRGSAIALPLDDESVDLVITSPPYFGLRSYEDGGEHYDGQVGAEPTPAAYLDALVAATAEMARVLKPSGSIWVNLGDKYADRAGPVWAGSSDRLTGRPPKPRRSSSTSMAPRKSLLGLPWRYAIRCVDELGLILRQEIVWEKPNGLPESVTDRVRRSHEQWFHFTRAPRYYSSVDALREPHAAGTAARYASGYGDKAKTNAARKTVGIDLGGDWTLNPLGKLPGSVWTIATEPLRLPEELGVDHFAAFPTEWPRRLVEGWSPASVCTACGAGRRPVLAKELVPDAQGRVGRHGGNRADTPLAGPARATLNGLSVRTVTGYECDCPDTSAPARPAVVLDPFGGTGTTALVADVLGRHGISVDMSADYCRLAGWRTSDPKQRAKAARLEFTPAIDQNPGQTDLFEFVSGAKEVV